MKSKQTKPLFYTNEFIKQFGIFVGLANKVNATKVSVASALQDADYIDAFNDSLAAIAKKAGKSVKSNTTTKARSYKRISGEAGKGVRAAILSYLMKNPGKSRSEIASDLNIRLSTVCGQANVLKNTYLIHVVGEKIDESSGRSVEALALVPAKAKN